MSQDINNTIATSKTRRVIKNLRWYVLVLFLLGVTVNYITRNSLGFLAPELKESLGITTEQYSWIVGAFQTAGRAQPVRHPGGVVFVHLAAVGLDIQFAGHR